MARARNIKPGFFRNADLVELSFEARLLFIGLWTLADRSGRLEDRPKQIKMEIFPADSVDCDALLNDIAATGMLARYSVDGKRYLHVVNFSKHQNPHKDEKASTIPDQFGNASSTKKESSKPDASTVQAPCKPDASTVAILLNPESGFLIPDSLIPDPLTRHASVIDAGEESQRVSRQGAICMVIKAEGINPVNPQHPELLALIDKGADVGRFAEAAKAASARGKGFAYVLGVVKGQMKDAANLANAPPARGKPHQVESFKERDARIGRERWEQMTGQRHPDSLPKQAANAIDITPQFLEIAQ